MMNFIYQVLGTPLGWLMYACYTITNNYGVAIILLTLLFKILLFPISILTQKNSIRMASFQQKLDEIKAYHAGDKERITDEELKLYKSEKYNPAIGCFPMLLQLALVLGLIYVIYNPLTFLLRIDTTVIQLLMEQLSVSDLGNYAQAEVIHLLNDGTSKLILESLPGLSSTTLNLIFNFNTTFLGLDLMIIPTFSQGIVIPIVSGLSCLLMCIVQNTLNIQQRMQKNSIKWGTTFFLVAISIYFPCVVPIGVGLYWVFNNLFSIVSMLIIHLIINPKKYLQIPTALPKKSKAEVAEEKALLKKDRQRQKLDSKHFYTANNDNKQLVFYSAKSGFYKYFSNVIDHILLNSEIVIHYVTSDPNDAIFSKNEPRIVPYYIGEKALISFMMKMDADMVVMTMPDLQKYHIKRSLVRKDIEYIYMFHGVASTHMVLREGALNHYDTIFCVGPHQVEEIKKTEELYDLPPKKIIECGYGVIENLWTHYRSLPYDQSVKPQILIAPSWQVGNIMELCLDSVLENLINKGYRVILRPHPEFIKRFPNKMQHIFDRYQHELNQDFIIETDFATNDTIYLSNILITDWSTIAHEFSYSTLKPSIFINTPMKIMNPEYEQIDIIPLDISLRDQIGQSIDVDKLDTLPSLVNDMLQHTDSYRSRIKNLRSKYLFNFGSSGEVGGNYIIQTLEKKS